MQIRSRRYACCPVSFFFPRKRTSRLRRFFSKLLLQRLLAMVWASHMALQIAAAWKELKQPLVKIRRCSMSGCTDACSTPKSMWKKRAKGGMGKVSLKQILVMCNDPWSEELNQDLIPWSRFLSCAMTLVRRIKPRFNSFKSILVMCNDPWSEELNHDLILESWGVCASQR